MNRRGFVIGLSAIIAAPAIVRASSLMPVKLFEPFTFARPMTATEVERLFQEFCRRDVIRFDSQVQFLISALDEAGITFRVPIPPALPPRLFSAPGQS